MTRTIGVLVLFAFALTLPCANICAVSLADDETITTLNLCDHGSPVAPGQTIALTEPAYDVPAIVLADNLPLEKPDLYEFNIIFPIDRPPAV
jgi:hypothetical protein